MKIQLLIFCLLVVYGSCRVYGEEKDVAKEIQNDGDFTDYANVPYTSLAKNKRDNWLSTITAPIKAVLRLFGLQYSVMSTFVDTTAFAFGSLTGQDVCTEINDLSFITVPKNILQNPIEAIKSLLCYIGQNIGKQGQMVMEKVMELSMTACTNLLLPGMHVTLNTVKDTGLLPPQVNSMIETFNAYYIILQFLNIIPK